MTASSEHMTMATTDIIRRKQSPGDRVECEVELEAGAVIMHMSNLKTS